jgi:hypothetical protein
MPNTQPDFQRRAAGRGALDWARWCGPGTEGGLCLDGGGGGWRRLDSGGRAGRLGRSRRPSRLLRRLLSSCLDYRNYLGVTYHLRRNHLVFT